MLYYVWLGARTGDSFTVLFSCLSFVATVLGAVGALVAARRVVPGMRWLAVLAATISTTVFLLAAIRTLPSWPFADIGLIISWAVLSGVVACASIFVASTGMPNKSLERTREG